MYLLSQNSDISLFENSAAETLINFACARLNIDRFEFLKSKEKKIVAMRFHVQYILNKDFAMPMTKIAYIFNVDHSTVSSNISSIGPLIRNMVALNRRAKMLETAKQ